MAKVRETPVNGSDTPPAEDPKERPEATKEAKAKPKDAPSSKIYVLVVGEAPESDQIGWAREESAYDDLKAFAKDTGVNTDQVHVYELGKKKVIKIEIAIEDA